MKYEDFKETDIGKEVIYTPTNDVGVITSIGAHYIFVRFLGPNGEACRPGDLKFK